MKLTKKRWLILIASCLINLCIGSLYAWSVFVAPMAEYINSVKSLGLTTGSMAVVFVIANSVGPFTMISGVISMIDLDLKKLFLLVVFFLGAECFYLDLHKVLVF
ncbi:hypothetical protein Q5O14_11740 [Eubacteriaceae bacterium ES2]|nr:hypothetical protein Q5O14_11740 [Eubacteriaceae bacterium ES2]